MFTFDFEAFFCFVFVSLLACEERAEDVVEWRDIRPRNERSGRDTRPAQVENDKTVTVKAGGTMRAKRNEPKMNAAPTRTEL